MCSSDLAMDWGANASGNGKVASYRVIVATCSVGRWPVAKPANPSTAIARTIWRMRSARKFQVTTASPSRKGATGTPFAAMVIGTITPPLILAGILKFPPAETAYLVSVALLASALGTWLQCRQRGPVGAGLLSVTGTSFSFIGPLVMAGQAGGLGLMVGVSLVAAPILILLAPFLSRLRSVFTPLVSGVVVILIGASLLPTAFMSMAAPVAPGAPAWAGLLVAGIVVLVVR